MLSFSIHYISSSSIESLVLCTQLYDPLCPSVCLLVRRSITPSFFCCLTSFLVILSHLKLFQVSLHLVSWSFCLLDLLSFVKWRFHEFYSLDDLKNLFTVRAFLLHSMQWRNFFLQNCLNRQLLYIFCSVLFFSWTL